MSQAGPASRCPSGFGPPPSFGFSGPNSLADMDPLGPNMLTDLDPLRGFFIPQPKKSCQSKSSTVE